MAKITKTSVVYPSTTNVVAKVPVNVEYDFTKLPFGNGNLNRQEFLLFSTLLHNLKDKGEDTIVLTASDLSRITGEVRKERIHKNLSKIAHIFAGQMFEFKTIEDGKKYKNLVLLFDNFKYEEEYTPNFKLEVSISKSFLKLLNNLGQKGIRYFDYDINAIKALPNKTFDSLLYVFLCAEAIKGKNGVIITEEDFVNKMAVPKKLVKNGVYKRFLLPAIEEMINRGVLKKNVVIEKLGNGSYKIKYELKKKQEDLFSGLEKEKE